MAFLKSWRRRRALAKTRIDDALWLRVVARLPFLRGLTADELKRLRELAVLFLTEKEMHGAGGLGLDDDICLSIAVQACLPILNLGVDCYAGWIGVVVYPDEFLIEREEMDEHGVVHRYREGISGEAWDGGPVVLSWRDASSGSHAGYNVVIHEFAHKLAMSSTAGSDDDGFPLPRPGMDRARWQNVLEAAFRRFCGQVERREPTFVDPYAAEHPAEFFAVMSEMFFTASAVLARDWPELYAQLSAYYRQDPAGVLDMPA
ncbi:MAG: zinc-dependent peptidase [Betaproteobacteria bacterium]|nr:zinc-dependent peptidase [Betaproteobacteria bacterium]